jgi:hypothetical protein
MEQMEGVAAMDDVTEWRRGTDVAITTITAACRSRDWEILDGLAALLGIGDTPFQRGVWEAICEALGNPSLR